MDVHALCFYVACVNLCQLNNMFIIHVIFFNISVLDHHEVVFSSNMFCKYYFLGLFLLNLEFGKTSISVINR